MLLFIIHIHVPMIWGVSDFSNDPSNTDFSVPRNPVIMNPQFLTAGPGQPQIMMNQAPPVYQQNFVPQPFDPVKGQPISNVQPVQYMGQPMMPIQTYPVPTVLAPMPIVPLQNLNSNPALVSCPTCGCVATTNAQPKIGNTNQ
jgi:hypothetical protein